jgi:glucoamylase
MLAWRLHRADALADFDPYPMVRRAARYLIGHGPATPQERWEENSGYSPSTLASNIAGLICAANFARLHKDEATARYLTEYADVLESHVERWTVTTVGTLVPEVHRHYIRITPADPGDPIPHEDPDHSVIRIRNCAPGAQADFPTREIVDPGFLELVRYGIRRAGDPLIEDSLRVIDAVLKTDFPGGPCWRRYNHDGYGQRDDGGPFVGWGMGRPWPLLTGERGHYELAAGRDVTRYLRAMENFATATRLLPEQIWDGPDNPRAHMFFGKPTGAAMPLMWAHAEYIKLLRSVADGGVFDLIPEVAERYLNHRGRQDLRVWKQNRQIQSVADASVVRIQAENPFTLHWSNDGWKTPVDTVAQTTAIGIYFVDIAIAPNDRAAILFTFLWMDGGRWEGRDYKIDVCAD